MVRVRPNRNLALLKITVLTVVVLGHSQRNEGNYVDLC